MSYLEYFDYSYRIRKGWVNVVELTTAYEIGRFPIQADMNRRWLKRPIDPSGVYAEWGETAQGFGGGAQALGQATFTWYFGPYKPSQTQYWKTNSNLFDDKPSQQFTVMTWNRSGTWEVVWVTGYFNPPSEGFEPGGWKSWLRLAIPFLVHQAAPAGPNLAPLLTVPIPLTNGDNGNLESSTINSGDGATYDATLLTVELPVELVFVSATPGADWTLEYFRSGAWQATVGGTPSLVTAVRGTYSAAIPAGDTTNEFIITVNPSSAGDVEVTSTVSTSGDTVPGNDVLVTEVTVGA